MKEKSLYKYVEKFLIEELECFATFQNAGTLYSGFADVIGIKDIGGRTFGDFEVIAVEVKTSTYNFAKHLGQALGYSLLSHRCYLATYLKGPYKTEQEQMATHLGVGLLRIYNRQCYKVLSAPRHEPISSLMLKMLERKNYVICSICGTLTEAKGWTTDARESVEKGIVFYYVKELPQRRVIFSGEKSPTRWVHICGDCMQELSLSGQAMNNGN